MGSGTTLDSGFSRGAVNSNIVSFDLDSDGDGLNNPNDCPALADCDGTTDTDGDGTNDFFDSDDDGDGLSTSDERSTYATNPFDIDTDDGGLPDGFEVQQGLNPLDSSDDVCPANYSTDSDGDGLLDCEEYLIGSNPNLSDVQVQGSGTFGCGSISTTNYRASAGLWMIILLVMLSWLGLRKQSKKKSPDKTKRKIWPLFLSTVLFLSALPSANALNVQHFRPLPEGY
jgi:hypothetical protein